MYVPCWPDIFERTGENKSWTSHWVHTRKTKKLRNELKNRKKKANVNFLGFAGWPTIGEWDFIALKTIHHNFLMLEFLFRTKY